MLKLNLVLLNHCLSCPVVFILLFFFTLGKTSIFCDTTIVYLYLFHLNCDQSKCYILQCRSKGYISGGGGGTRVPEARATRGGWGHAPP